MAVDRITREDRVEQSALDLLRERLFGVREYPPDQVELLDAFEPARFEAMRTLDRSYIALGFNFDDGGRPFELGSPLLQRVYSLEVWVIALTPQIGRNLANAIREELQAAGAIPLKDIAQPDAPIIDFLELNPIAVQRQPVPDPKPWQENVYTVHVPVVDCYYP